MVRDVFSTFENARFKPVYKLKICFHNSIQLSWLFKSIKVIFVSGHGLNGVKPQKLTNVSIKKAIEKHMARNHFI